MHAYRAKIQSRFSRKQSLKRKIFLLYFRLLFSRIITPFPLVPPVINHPVYVRDVGTSGLSLGRSPILGLEVTQLVAERSHGHGMNVLPNRELPVLCDTRCINKQAPARSNVGFTRICLRRLVFCWYPRSICNWQMWSYQSFILAITLENLLLSSRQSIWK